MAATDIIFKIATEEREFEQIHCLNYKTFVKEIPQHQANSEERLVDPYHSENTYCICLRGKQLLGMLACRGKRPFSLDRKLADLDAYLPPYESICEIRLLAVEKEARGTRVLLGLMKMLHEHCKQQGYDLAVISGTIRQLKLYNHLGFKAFGPLVGTSAASFQPMYITRELLNQKLTELLEAFESRQDRTENGKQISREIKKQDYNDRVNFLPGPVKLREEVCRAFAQPPLSHRSGQFLEDMAKIKGKLAELVNAQHVQVLLGSGTLANDVVAAYLSLNMGKKRGMVLSNGEFGDRLLDQASRAGLNYEEYRVPWGNAFNYEDLEKRLRRKIGESIDWIWGAHLETSTGVLNNLIKLKALCSQNQVALALDCISSIGSLPVDLSGVYLASGVSGKALCSYAGLSFIFYNQELKSGHLPRYLDLVLYEQAEGVPFTQSSNLVYALKEALAYALVKDTTVNQRLTEKLRVALSQLGIQVLASVRDGAPNVLTLVLPQEVSTLKLGEKLEEVGYDISYRSNYLLKRNWLQICLLGEYQPGDIDEFPEVFAKCLENIQA